MAGDAANIVLGAIIEKAITPVLDTIGRHLGYLFCYKSNIKNLGKGVAQLEKSRNDAVIFFEGKKRNNEETTQSSYGWLEEVKEVIEVSKEVENGTTRLKGCLNLKGRYVLSRKSTKLAAEIQTLQNKAPKGSTTNSVLPAGMLQGAAANEASKGYKTRIQTVDEVKKAFGNDAISVIGICGLGGVGKTTMVHEVRAWARENNLIDDFAMTSVSRDQNLFKIQGDLAEMLGLTSLKEEKNVIARADQLHKRLTNGNKVLVVFDDVWRDIKLKDVGVPSGSELTKCKVVITSRQEGVCIDIEKSIKVQVLAKEEARALFRKTAGEEVEKNKLEQIADDLADECGGLPIAILTLSRALSNKDRRAWKDALARLRHGSLTRINGMEKEVYESIKLSYDFLESENQKEAQSLLLICCQHQEDAVIYVEKLAEYCLSLELFEGVTGVVEARNRAYTLIEHLKSCFLLQAVDVDYENYADKSWRDEEVKVHDVVRDVCLSIVSRVNEESGVLHMQIMEQETDSVYKIDTTNVDYPKVKLSVIDKQTIRVLQQKGELRVLERFTEGELWLTGYTVTPLPEFQVLANLRMLYLEGERIDEYWMGEVMRLTKLETLSFRDSSIDCLPCALGQLSNLKSLDLRCIYNHGLMIPIPMGILGGLGKLEVLYMGNHHFAEKSFSNEVIEGERETRISELNLLTNLTTLQILMLDPVGLLGLKHSLFNKLESFSFRSAGRRDMRNMNRWSYVRPLLMKTIELEKTEVKWVLEDKIQRIVSSAVELCLDDMKDWTDPLIIKQFGSLRKLEMRRCNQLKYIIADGNNSVFKNLEMLSIGEMSNVTEFCQNGYLPPEGSLYKLQELKLWSLSKMRYLWGGPTEPLCLVNLTKVTIRRCGALECIFPHSAIKCLTQLSDLRVFECDMLMGIVSKGGERKVGGRGEEITQEPNDLLIHFPKLRYVDISDSISLKSFYNLDGPGQPLFNSLVMLPSIERLHLGQNDSIKAVFDFDGFEARTMREDECSLFYELRHIHLSRLSELEHICRQVPKDVHIFQNLTLLTVKDCGRLSYLIPSSIAHMLVNLIELDVGNCTGMTEVFYNMNEEEEHGELKKKIILPSLYAVTLYELHNILSFSDQQVFEFPSLEIILIIGCPRMETFYSRKPRVARSGMLEENVHKGEGTSKESGGGEISNVSSDLVHHFPKLSKVSISSTPNFRGFLHNLNNDEDTPLPLSYPWVMLPSIKTLNFDRNESLKAAFDFEGFEAVTMRKDPHALLCELRSIYITNLPNLEHLCRQVPKGIHIFQQLTNLTVENCGSLTYLLPSSIAHMLVNLQYLMVNECRGMKEIISIINLEDCGKMENKFVLRSLSYVKLSKLENLSSFCSSDQLVFEFPSLETVVISECPKIETFCWQIPRVGPRGMSVENVSEEGPIVGGRGICDLVAQFPKLEDVTLEGTPSFRGFYNLHNDNSRLLPLYSPMVMLSRMKKIKVDGLEMVKQIVGGKILDINRFVGSDWLQNLGSIEVRFCNSLDSVFDFEWQQVRGENTQILTLGKLEKIELISLPNLTCIFRCRMKDISIPELHSIHIEDCGSLVNVAASNLVKRLGNLNRVSLWKCGSIKVVFDFEGLNVIRDNAPSVLGELEEINLWKLPKVEHVCRLVTRDIHVFKNLKTLRVDDCGSMDFLIPSSMVHMLVNLQEVTIANCGSMKTVFCNMNEEEDCGELGKEIVFCSLRSVKLIELEKLSSFFSTDQHGFQLLETVSKGEETTPIGGGDIRKETKDHLVLKFPILEDICLHKLTNFQGFYTLGDDEGRLRPLFNPLVIFPSMAKLKVYELHQLKQIVGDIPSFAASGSLNNLQMVDIRGCDSLISLFDFEGKQIMEETPVLDYEGYLVKREDAHSVLSKLEIIWLRLLPNLEHICRQVPKEIHGFQNLRSLCVYGCHSLSYLLTSTMAHMLLNLEFLIVFNCKSMKEVIKIDEDCDRKKIVFCSLSHVEILSMEKLSSFCASELLEFDFSELDSVYIVECPAMTTFCNGNLTAEKLQGVYYDDTIDDVNNYEDYFDDDGGDCIYDSYDVDKVFWEFNINETIRYCNASKNRVNQTASDLKEEGAVDDDDVEKKDDDNVGDKPISKNELNETALHLNPISSRVIQISSHVREDGVGIQATAEVVDTEYDQCDQEGTSSGKENSTMVPLVISSSPPVADYKTMKKLSSNSPDGNPLEKVVVMTTTASSQSTPGNELNELKNRTGESVFEAIEVPQSNLDDIKNEAAGCTSELVPYTVGQADSPVALASWRGHMVTLGDKDLLESVEKHFPGTYDGVNFRNEAIWQFALDIFCCYLSKFLVASVCDLSSKEVAQLRDMLLDLIETFKFNLEWVLNRLNKVEKLRFGSPFPGELAEIERERAPLLTKVENLVADLALAKEELGKLDVLRETKLKMLDDEFGSGSLELLEGSLGRDLLPSY